MLRAEIIEQHSDCNELLIPHQAPLVSSIIVNPTGKNRFSYLSPSKINKIFITQHI